MEFIKAGKTTEQFSKVKMVAQCRYQNSLTEIREIHVLQLRQHRKIVRCIKGRE